jgi:ADP-heptose:LPS heptosyltransferase
VIGFDATNGIAVEPRRVAIFRALALGDLLCAVPALRALRRAWPRAKITLVGLPWAREFAARFSAYIDEFVEFPGWPGLPEREPALAHIPCFLADIQRGGFDLAIQLHGSGTIVNSLVALFGARQTAGFVPPRYYCPNERTFAPWPEEGLEVERLLSLVDFLGLSRAGDELEFPLTDEDWVEAGRLLSGRADSQPLAVIHAGASVPERRWAKENFAAVADALAERGFCIALTGVASERPVVTQLASHLSYDAADLCGATNLGSLGALVASAAVVICNDTGISHVAAALKTPSVVLSTSDNPARWSPVNHRLHRVLLQESGVTPREVVRQAMEVIASPDRSTRCQRLQLQTA